jgi:hypothetical protein
MFSLCLCVEKTNVSKNKRAENTTIKISELTIKLQTKQ